VRLEDLTTAQIESTVTLTFGGIDMVITFLNKQDVVILPFVFVTGTVSHMLGMWLKNSFGYCSAT